MFFFAAPKREWTFKPWQTKKFFSFFLSFCRLFVGFLSIFCSFFFPFQAQHMKISIRPGLIDCKVILIANKPSFSLQRNTHNFFSLSFVLEPFLMIWETPKLCASRKLQTFFIPAGRPKLNSPFTCFVGFDVLLIRQSPLISLHKFSYFDTFADDMWFEMTTTIIATSVASWWWWDQCLGDRCRIYIKPFIDLKLMSISNDKFSGS